MLTDEQFDQIHETYIPPANYARAVADRAYDLGVAAGIEHANAQAREPYTPEERASIKATIKATIKAIRALKP